MATMTSYSNSTDSNITDVYYLILKISEMACLNFWYNLMTHSHPGSRVRTDVSEIQQEVALVRACLVVHPPLADRGRFLSNCHLN